MFKTSVLLEFMSLVKDEISTRLPKESFELIVILTYFQNTFAFEENKNMKKLKRHSILLTIKVGKYKTRYLQKMKIQDPHTHELSF